MSVPHADEEPAEAAAACFDDVPGVKCRGEGAARAVGVGSGDGTAEARCRGVDGVFVARDVVWRPWEGEYMHGSKYSHFNAKEHARYTDFEVRVGDLIAGFQRTAGASEKRYNERLPEREKDDKLDAENLKKRSMW